MTLRILKSRFKILKPGPDAGAEFVVRYEIARLSRENQERLAGKVERVSNTRGDGLGYDVLSFDGDGKERLIEVKTTRYGASTPST